MNHEDGEEKTAALAKAVREVFPAVPGARRGRPCPGGSGHRPGPQRDAALP